jgi:hypothetical protein
MSGKKRKRINNGDLTGLKQDRFRNSRFEIRPENSSQSGLGVPKKTLNTIGGPYQENRGRRSANENIVDSQNPFVSGSLENWNHKTGWDRYFDSGYDKSFNRPHGGAIKFQTGHRGKGPRGYKRLDENIYDDVCSTLTVSPFVDATGIEVFVRDGIVTLRGSVSSRNEKKAAELAIESISGVMDVQNYLIPKNLLTNIAGETYE